MTTSNTNYYKTLGVPEGANQKRIHKAYRKLISSLPHSDNKKNQDKIDEIEKAYSVLSDKDQRAKYDKKLHAPKNNNESPFTKMDKIFDSFFDKDPFKGFDDDFFKLGKRPLKLLDKDFFDDETDSNNEEVKETPKKLFKSQSISTESSTVIKDGKRTSKMRKTVIGTDGKKDVKVIEEHEDEDGKVKRSVKHMKDGKEAKAITSEADDEDFPLLGRRMPRLLALL